MQICADRFFVWFFGFENAEMMGYEVGGVEMVRGSVVCEWRDWRVGKEEL